MKRIIPFFLIVLLLVSGCSGGDVAEAFQAGYEKGYAEGLAAAQAAATAAPDASTPAPTVEPAADPTPETAKALTYGDTFEFDGFEITFSPEYEFTKVNNQFSDLNDRDIIAIPITVTNKSGSTGSLNMFYFSSFNPAGTQSETCHTYFTEDDIAWAGEMRDGATVNAKMHIVYEGDGTYYVKFDNFATEIEVELPIVKPAE